MAATVVLVHGRNQQHQIGTELETVWEGHLLGGLQDAGFAADAIPLERVLFPFHGDLYQGYSLAMRHSTDVGEKTEQLRFERDYAKKVRDKLAKRKVKLKPRSSVAAAARAAATTRAATGASPPSLATSWYDPFLEILDRVPGFGPGVVRLIMRDVHDYLRNADGLRKRTMERVTPALSNAQQDQPLIVIAHSLGSIVTYDILNTSPNLRVDLLITIGSPLGIDGSVRNRLLKDKQGRRDVPAGVGRWVNFADGDDVVALDEKLGDDFKRGGQRIITDFKVKNPKGSGRNPHSSSSYLRQAKLAQELARALGL